ncbi:YkyA family protein [Ignavigranum ruoffiae]|uniref:Putative cell-wall binding lipoprotein n=1 Tax=Ignavigranum ruoffiae TaxID=89093 RepID=A0A1H8ZHJ1_9LACT|nr:YkyA family protein [Ignavigranum ruoffiae]SEP63753.1 Putative cell-wall binding lipoprotein [Ignavigranum ruoffiae]
MKKYIQLLLIPCLILALTACDSSINRIDRTFTLVQENITKIVNELTEIQLLESHVQDDFETTLKASEDLSAFRAEDSVILQNVNQRSEHLNNLADLINELDKLIEEINNQEPNKDEQIKAQVDAIVAELEPLTANLKVYLKDYQDSLQPEKQTYQAVANPNNDYTTFFKVFDNVNILNKTNQINLEKVLGYFEPINAKLIDFKVYLTNLKK